MGYFKRWSYIPKSQKKKILKLLIQSTSKILKLRSMTITKKKFGIELDTNGEIFLLALENEEERKEWHTAISDNLEKEPGSSNSGIKKKQSTAMRLKKNVGGNMATSSAGKSLIKEFVGKDGVKLIDIVKKAVAIYDSKKKS